VGVRRYQDLITWQLADAFKNEVTRIVRGSREAWLDLKYRSQVLEASRAVGKDVAEGFLRCSPRQFATFLDYALASMAEAELRLSDGIELAYFPETECHAARRLAKRCTVAILRLKQSQLRYAEALDLERKTTARLARRRPEQRAPRT